MRKGSWCVAISFVPFIALYLCMYERNCCERQDEGVITREEADDVRAKHRAFLDAELEKSSSSSSNAPASNSSDAMYKPLSGTWKGMVWPTNTNSNAQSASDSKHVHVMDPGTGVDIDTLRKVGGASVKVPDGFVRASVMLGLGFIFSRC